MVPLSTVSESRKKTIQSETVWQPADSLSSRVRKLREQFLSFYTRKYTNEVRAYTTGMPWDLVYSIWSWTNVPEVAMFQPGFRSYLLASAETVSLPDDFFDLPIVIRQAIFFREVVKHHLPIDVLKGELIVGSHFNTALSRCLNEREAIQRDREEAAFFREWKVLNEHGVGNCAAVPGHLVPDYPKILKVGWQGVSEEAQAIIRHPYTSTEQRHLARALIHCAKTVHEFMHRYVKLLLNLESEEVDPTRKAELVNMAKICSRVPYFPPQTFPEALQALWTTHMLLMAAESYPGPGISPGRVDQYLFPYYQADLNAGRLTRLEAKEWLECWMIKHNYVYDYQGWTGTNQGINSSFGQLITLGGINADGADASNALTYLFLDAIEELNLLEPKPNVRIHAKTPDKLLERMVVMLSHAQGAPFLINFDENSIAGLAWQGLPVDRLWDYAPVGCLENTLAGDDRSGTVDVNLNLAKAVELTFSNGKDLRTGKQIGPKTGDPLGFRSYAEFEAAFKKQLLKLIDWMVRVNNMADAGRARWEPVPYLSALVGGCLESGKDSNAGGAHFNFLTVEAIALATTADSLAAVKKLVFEENSLSMQDLLSAMQVNYEGYEPLRQILLNKAPKYGNDDPYADQVARELSHFWTEEVFKRYSPTGKRYRGGYLSWNYWVAYAPFVAATPDGRRRGQFLSNAVCPVNGADRKGPTAVIKSVGNLDLFTAPNGSSHTISFSPSLLRDPEHRQKLIALLRAYGKVGGSALQINIIDAEMLRAAQQHPDEYRNLLVRITGYNAYFTGLGKEIQDEIIARESHQI
jgi:pyruvate formate-lyase/glycerol dehydratase family glycyl radical enzyme